MLKCVACEQEVENLDPRQPLCGPCEKSHLDALNSIDVVLRCEVCRDEVTVTIVPSSPGPTVMPVVYCSEVCCADDPESGWESDEGLDEPAREPFTSDFEDDDCPF